MRPEPGRLFHPTGYDYTVQRVWSNKAAAAGQDPCVPAAPGPYFNSAPVLDDTITMSLQGQSVATKGVSIPIGQSKTIELDLFSDGPTGGPWTVQAIDLTNALQQASATALTFTFDKTNGQNGDKLHMTITAQAKGTYGIEEFLLVSRLGARATLWIGAVGS